MKTPREPAAPAVTPNPAAPAAAAKPSEAGRPASSAAEALQSGSAAAAVQARDVEPGSIAPVRSRYRVKDDSGRIAGKRVKKRQIVELTAAEAKYLAPPHGDRIELADKSASAEDEDKKD